MIRLERVPITAMVLLAASTLAGCAFPETDKERLRAIRTEAAALMARYPSATLDPVDVQAADLPPTLATLRPDMVTIYDWGVSITVKASFDGGWGYHVPRDQRYLPMPKGCYSEPFEGVFWHNPC